MIFLSIFISTGAGTVSFDNSDVTVHQTDKDVIVKLVRRNGENGRVVVPWSVCSCDENSIYKVV